MMPPMTAMMLWIIFLGADPAGTAVAKLPKPVAREMTAAVLALNKALGLENWPAKGVKPCVDRGELEALGKDVSPEDAKKCAESALAAAELAGLGKSYALGIIMADIGPATVFAVGTGEAAGWGAYSCDPTRKCNPTKLSGPSKQARRLATRYERACASDKTIWLPSRAAACLAK
jgi:hypothetical protein